MNPTLNLRRIVTGLLAVAGPLALSLWHAGTVGAAEPARAAVTPRAASRVRQSSPAYVPNEVVVGYEQGPFPSVAGDIANRKGVRAVATGAPVPQTLVLRLPPGVSVTAAVQRLRHRPGVAYAVPNYLAHAAGGDWIPNDRGRTHTYGGWERLQWNFLSSAGINAPQAWANLIADHHAGARGVTVAILDTGVAYRNWGRFKRSPDFNRTRFVAPYDFVAHDRYALDRAGHGTFVAGVVAESTNNRIGLTGLAYHARIMPVRVLDSNSSGDAATIARGVRWAVNHHAQVINLSLEFAPQLGASAIPDLLGALRYAERHNVVVVGAAGNDYADEVSYPARARGVIAVGATTSDRCLAQYSNTGSRVDLVAPGGGPDRFLGSDPDCHPGRALRSIFQMTFFSRRHPGRFGFPSGIYGTSMAAPEVSATAAMIIASGILGRQPTPAEILNRLEQTAQPLGNGHPNEDFGWGLLNAGAATAPLG